MTPTFPEKSQNYRYAEDVFYLQFNDISFYVEDDEHENFYFCILSKLFPDIKIEKIFPLGGKPAVIDMSMEHVGDRKRIFIVDLDFDDTLGITVDAENVFYLSRYSIENFLIEEFAFTEYVVSTLPRLNKNQIRSNLSFPETVSEIKDKLTDVIYLHLVAQHQNISIQNVSRSVFEFITVEGSEVGINEAGLNRYRNQIESALKTKDGRLRIEAQLRRLRKNIQINCDHSFFKRCPGKYLVDIYRKLIAQKFGFGKEDSRDSFCYRTAEKCEFHTLFDLRDEILLYINQQAKPGKVSNEASNPGQARIQDRQSAGQSRW